MTSQTTRRDDDPVHPNYDGLTFRPTTDRSGVVAIPTSAQRPPPYSYLPIPVAIRFVGTLQELIAQLREGDPENYAATYFESVQDDLCAAIEACRPAPPPEPQEATVG